MLCRLLAKIPPKSRKIFTSILTPEGLLQITNLLIMERERLNVFCLDYIDSDVQRLYGKQMRNKELTTEEETLLRVSPKAFKGRLTTGDKISNIEAIAIVNNLITLSDKMSVEINDLSLSTDSGACSDVMILGERLSILNLNPRKFTELVYSNIFTQPSWVVQEIKKLLTYKADVGEVALFEDYKGLQEELTRLGLLSEEDDTALAQLMSLRVAGTLNDDQTRSVIRKLLVGAKQLDDEFSYEPYVELKRVLPQYHSVNVKWLLWFVTSFVGVHNPYVTPAISLEWLLAFYRKGVELTC